MTPEGNVSSENLALQLEQAREHVRQAAAAFSDPNKYPGPSGESNEDELERELQEAVRERQRAQARLDEQKTLH